MPRPRKQGSNDDILALLSPERRAAILDEAVGAHTRTLVARHQGGTFADLVDALRVDFNVHGVISTGAVQDQAQFGPGGAWGLRLALNLDFRLWQGLFARAATFYERFELSFNGMPQPGRGPIEGGAADQFYGGILSVGYAY